MPATSYDVFFRDIEITVIVVGHNDIIDRFDPIEALADIVIRKLLAHGGMERSIVV